jgi:hypothetical protein
MTLEEIIARNAAVHPWRDDDLVTWLFENSLEPFCFECADWHNPDEEHSMVWSK